MRMRPTCRPLGRFHARDLADRVGQRRDLAQPFAIGDAIESSVSRSVGSVEPVRAAGSRSRAFSQDFPARLEAVGAEPQRGVLHVARKLSDPLGGGLGAARQVLNQLRLAHHRLS
jgi:hypothetical protein